MLPEQNLLNAYYTLIERIHQ